MATAYSVISPSLLGGIACADLAGASLPDPDSDAGRLLPFPLTTESTQEGLPVPVGGAFDGYEAPVHGLAVFDKIHVVPREIELGPVGSEQQFLAEIWNAYRARAQTLQSIDHAGTSGVQVVDHLGLPAHYPATHSEVYAVTVSGEGAPLIDATLTWVFVGLFGETALHVTGYRFIALGFQPNMEREIVEAIGYLTDVIEAYDGGEQRVQLREIPVGTVSFSLLHLDTRSAQLASAILFGNLGKPFGVPRWQYQTELLQPAAADEVEIFLDTTDLPFEIGGLALLWSDDFTVEGHVIDDVQADRLVLSLGLRKAWPATKTKVMPMVVGRLSTEETFSWESLIAGSQELTFDIDGFKP